MAEAASNDEQVGQGAEVHPDPVREAVSEAAGGPRHGTAAVVLALLVDLAVAVAAGYGSTVTDSSSVLATAALAGAAAFGLLLLLLAGRRARSASADEHPLGSGRERYYWPFVGAMALLAAAALVALDAARRALDDPRAVERPEWALAGLGVAVVVAALSLRFTAAKVAEVRDQVPYRAFVRRATHPELPVVLLLQAGVVTGSALALGGVALAEVTDEVRWDGWTPLGVAAVVGLVVLALLAALKGLLVGEGATTRQLEAIRAAIEIEPEVVRLVHLHTRHLAPGELLVGAKIEFQHDLTVVEVADVVDRVERNVRDNVAQARVLYLEPGVDEAHRGVGGYVAEHAGRIDPDDPAYAQITGQQPAVVVDDDDIWV